MGVCLFLLSFAVLLLFCVVFACFNVFICLCVVVVVVCGLFCFFVFFWVMEGMYMHRLFPGDVQVSVYLCDHFLGNSTIKFQFIK